MATKKDARIETPKPKKRKIIKTPTTKISGNGRTKKKKKTGGK